MSLALADTGAKWLSKVVVCSVVFSPFPPLTPLLPPSTSLSLLFFFLHLNFKVNRGIQPVHIYFDS